MSIGIFSMPVACDTCGLTAQAVSVVSNCREDWSNSVQMKLPDGFRVKVGQAIVFVADDPNDRGPMYRRDFMVCLECARKEMIGEITIEDGSSPLGNEVEPEVTTAKSDDDTDRLLRQAEELRASFAHMAEESSELGADDLLDARLTAVTLYALTATILRLQHQVGELSGPPTAKPKSYVENCLIEAREGYRAKSLFTLVKDQIYPTLDGYAIVPRTKYEKMVADLKTSTTDGN